LSLTNIPLPEVLRYVATLSNLELTAERAAYFLQPMKDGTATKPAPPAAGKSTAAKKASEIIIPVLDTKDATVAEVVEFLRLRAQALDPSKVGVNLILKEDGDAQSAKITLSLKEIPLSEALKYVAQLAGLEIEATEFAIILKSREKK
jgi:hypothetical protein